jgi:hypothetical protein
MDDGAMQNGLCAVGRVKLQGLADDQAATNGRVDKLEVKMDRITWLLVATLVTVVVNLGYMLAGR